jgi:hypothetical protein
MTGEEAGTRATHGKMERLDSAVVAQLVEHFLGKEEVSGSIPDNGSISSFLYLE